MLSRPKKKALRKEKRALITELNKANDQVASLEELVFELDKRLEQVKVVNESAEATQEPSTSIPPGIVASVRLRYAQQNDSSRSSIPRKAEGPHSSTTQDIHGEEKTRIAERSQSEVSAKTDRAMKSGQDLTANESSVNHDGEVSVAKFKEMRRMLAFKELQMAELTKKLQFLQEENDRLQQLRVVEEKSNEMPQKSSTTNDASQKAAALQTALIKINLLRRKFAQEKYQAEQDKILLKQALESAAAEQQKTKSALDQTTTDKNHIEEMFFEALAKQKSSQERETQLAEELKVVRTNSLYPYGYPSGTESTERESILSVHSKGRSGNVTEAHDAFGDSVRSSRIIQSKSVEEGYSQKHPASPVYQDSNNIHPDSTQQTYQAISESASKPFTSPSLIKSKRGPFWKRSFVAGK